MGRRRDLDPDTHTDWLSKWADAYTEWLWKWARRSIFVLYLVVGLALLLGGLLGLIPFTGPVLPDGSYR